MGAAAELAGHDVAYVEPPFLRGLDAGGDAHPHDFAPQRISMWWRTAAGCASDCRINAGSGRGKAGPRCLRRSMPRSSQPDRDLRGLRPGARFASATPSQRVGHLCAARCWHLRHPTSNRLLRALPPPACSRHGACPPFERNASARSAKPREICQPNAGAWDGNYLRPMSE